MKFTHDKAMFFMEPTTTDGKIIIDDLTRKMAYALKNCKMNNLSVSGVDKKKVLHVHMGWKTLGVHTCICGARSESGDYGIEIKDNTPCKPNKVVVYNPTPDDPLDTIKTHPDPDDRTVYTNSLCAHYLAYHRSEVPEADLEKVSKLPMPPDDFEFSE